MDLFSKAKTREQWIRYVKTSIKKWGTDKGYEVPKNFSIAKCSTKESERIPLFVLPPFKGPKMFDTWNDNTLRNLCAHFSIINYVMTYCFPFIKDTLTNGDLKEYSDKLNEIIQLINPTILVLLGDQAQIPVLSRKHPLDVWHGELVPNCELKTMTLFSADYYCKRTKTEDKSFKYALRDNDWSKLKDVISLSNR